jgi:hypothetical protein
MQQQPVVYADLSNAELKAEWRRLKRFLKKAFVAVYRENAQNGLRAIEMEMRSRKEPEDDRAEMFSRAERRFEVYREVHV